MPRQPAAFFPHQLKIKKMLHIILCLLLSYACPSHSNNGNHNNGGQVTTLDDTRGDGGDTEGETGTIPPKP